MRLKELLLKEKLSQQLWEILAVKVKKTHWQIVKVWMETKASRYPMSYKKELLWLLQTLK